MDHSVECRPEKIIKTRSKTRSAIRMTELRTIQRRRTSMIADQNSFLAYLGLCQNVWKIICFMLHMLPFQWHFEVYWYEFFISYFIKNVKQCSVIAKQIMYAWLYSRVFQKKPGCIVFSRVFQKKILILTIQPAFCFIKNLSRSILLGTYLYWWILFMSLCFDDICIFDRLCIFERQKKKYRHFLNSLILKIKTKVDKHNNVLVIRFKCNVQTISQCTIVSR